MQYRLRTLLILLGVLPPLLWIGWVYSAWKAEKEREWVRRLFSNYAETQYFPPGPELKFSQETAASRPEPEPATIIDP